MRVAAVVVNWNGAEHLAGCLDALLAQDHTPFEVVVVDNASTDGSRAVLSAYLADAGERVRVVWNRTNRGFAGGANDGIAACPEADAILTVNPDVLPAGDFVRRPSPRSPATTAAGRCRASCCARSRPRPARP